MQKRRIVDTTIGAALLAGVVLASGPAMGASSVTASKSCGATGTTTTEASFTLATNQVVSWTASYNPVPGCNGDAFYVSTSGPNIADLAFTTTGQLSGTQFLNAGTYHISINTFLMGQGSYTVTYDQTASIGLAPASHNFGNILEDESSSAQTFTTSSTGDLPVTIGGITLSDPAHFEVLSGAPIGQEVPGNKTFQVRCNAGPTAGTWGTNITVQGTSSSGGTVTATTSASCTTIPKVPNISCPGIPSLGSADWFVGETKSVSRTFSNTGDEPLLITGPIQLFNDTTAGVFALIGVPSTAPLGDGASRSVSIQLQPPAEGVYSGHLVIPSNDPDEPIKQCFFQATGHHPVPIMRLEETLLDYHQVELGFSFKKAITVHNDGDAALTLDVTQLTPGGDPNLDHFELEVGPATVNPSDPPAVLEQIYHPESLGGPHTVLMRVTGNDLANPQDDVTLLGHGVNPVPIDSTLVLDRSGSMSDPAGDLGSKIRALQTAADLYVHLLRPDAGAGTGDKIGFVRYNHTNDVYLPLDFADDPATLGSHIALAEDKLSNAAIGDLSQLAPDGNTGIGGAIETAAGMLVGSPADRKHVMVVLTDGKENEDPRINTVIGPVQAADPNLLMYSVGLGSNIEPDKLQNITNVGNGYHQVEDDLSGTSIFNLEVFYFKIFVNATGMDLVVDPTHVVNLATSAPVLVDTARIVSSDRNATFLVLENPAMRPFYDLEFVDPRGQVMKVGSAVAGVPVHVMERHNYRIVRVVFPAVEQAPSYTGDWIVRLTPNGEWDPKHARESAEGAWAGATTTFPGWQSGQVPIGFAAAVASDYRMNVEVLPSGYLPGAQATLTASLSDRGWPAPNGVVSVDATTPSGTVYHNIKLYDDGSHGDVEANDATWTNRFIQTAESGSYEFFFQALGHNERGELAPREATRYLTLMHQSQDPEHPDEECIPCRLARWLWAIVIALLLLLLYCCCLRGRAVR